MGGSGRVGDPEGVCRRSASLVIHFKAQPLANDYLLGRMDVPYTPTSRSYHHSAVNVGGTLCLSRLRVSDQRGRLDLLARNSCNFHY